MSLPRNEAEGPEPVVAAEVVFPDGGPLIEAGRMRDRIVIQARDMPQREREIDRGLLVGCVKSAIFGRVLVLSHFHVKSALHRRDRAGHINVQPVDRSADHCEPVLLKVRNHGVVIVLSGTELTRELFHCEELMVGRAVGVIELFKQVVEARFVAQRQSDGEAHGLTGRQTPDSGALPLDVAGRV